MKSKLFLHPAERGGTFVLADGTHVYWAEGRNADTVVRHPDGRIEIVLAGEPHPAVTACDRLWESGTAETRCMNQRELLEWDQAWAAE
jgi:hypothetical protein